MKVRKGQFALVIVDLGAGLYDPSVSGRKHALGLVSEYVSGFDHRPHQVRIVHVTAVQPSTFAGMVVLRGNEPGRTFRHLEFDDVLAVCDAYEDAVDLRRRIREIGQRADAEIVRRNEPIIAEVRASALAELRTVLPVLPTVRHDDRN